MPLRKEIIMTIYIINCVEDKGTLKDGKGWTGVRLVIREVSDHEARTYIAKAAKDFPDDEFIDEISDTGALVVDRLLYDRFGRVIGYERN